MIIDTHTHLETFHRRNTLPDALARAREAGLASMITIGTSTEDWSLYRDIARQHPGFIHYSVGLHPCSVAENWADEVAQIEPFWSTSSPLPHPVALGECGLDRFHLPKNDPVAAECIFGWQRQAFAVQLDIVRSLACPLVVHSRGAFAECVAMIDDAGIAWERVVFHCFTEGPAEMNELLRRGGYGSFTGIITYKNADSIREAARVQGLARLMIETDAPYLTPMPNRGKPNEPAYLRHTAEFSAEQVFGVSYAEFATTTTANARRFFGDI